MKRIIPPLGAFRMKPYFLTKKSLFKTIQKKGEEPIDIRIVNACRIVGVKSNLDTDEYQLILAFYNFNSWFEIEIARSQLLKSEMKGLLNIGLDINAKNVDDVLEFLLLSEKRARHYYTYQHIGWHNYLGQSAYRLDQMISSQESIESEYVGNLALEPRGYLESWKQVVKQQILGHAELEMIMAAGFSAAIVGLLNVNGSDSVDTLLINIVGNSTTGKTTAAYVAVSAFGSPLMNQNGLIQSCNGTINAIQSTLNGNFGVPIVFDETSATDMNQSQLTNLIYSLAQNKEKARLNKESELKDLKTWASTIFFTGESSILDQANSNVGLRVRIFDFHHVQWTTDAQHSESIKQGFTQHFGHAGAVFSRALLQVGIEKVREVWKQFSLEIQQDLPQTQYRTRIAEKFALILTSAKFINHSLGLSLNLSAIQQVLVAQEKSVFEDRDIAKKFMKELKDYIIEHLRHFKVNNENFTSNQLQFGKIETVDEKLYCYILPAVFRNICKELGFSSARVVLDELKSWNCLKFDKGKLLTKKQILAPNERDQLPEKQKGVMVYCVIFEEDFIGVKKGYSSFSLPKHNRKLSSATEIEDDFISIDDM